MGAEWGSEMREESCSACEHDAGNAGLDQLSWVELDTYFVGAADEESQRIASMRRRAATSVPIPPAVSILNEAPF